MANTRIIIYFFIIICTFIKCDSGVKPIETRTKCIHERPNDKYECFNRISQDEKNAGYHCCYMKQSIAYSQRVEYQCYLLDEDEYNDIDATEHNYFEKYEERYRGINIECDKQSNIQINKYIYLIFTLLNLIF